MQMKNDTQMKKKDKILGYAEMAGETLVVAGAAAWLPMRGTAQVVFALGAVVFAIGRLLQTPPHEKYSPTDPKELTLRRLYHQRVIGMVALIVSAVVMNMPSGFHFGVYVAPSSWLMVFVVFVVIEVYTVFRISAVEKKDNEQK